MRGWCSPCFPCVVLAGVAAETNVLKVRRTVSFTCRHMNVHKVFDNQLMSMFIPGRFLLAWRKALVSGDLYLSISKMILPYP